jgi:F-type H+-transporting ATPase subunit b
MNINATLIGQSIAFFGFVWFCMKYVWPPLTAALDARKKTIADGLAAADRGRHEHELAERRAAEILRESKEEAANIIAQAQKRATEVIDESKGQARAEGERLLAAANAEIEQEINRAKEQLREEVVAISIAGATRILGREVNAEAQNELLEDLVAQI